MASRTLGRAISTALLAASAVSALLPSGVSARNAGESAHPTSLALVHLEVSAPHRQERILRSHGLEPAGRLDSIDVAIARGTAPEFRSLGRDPRVTLIEKNHRLDLLNDTATVATQVDKVRDKASAFRDPDGKRLDGSGIGVAVVDTGINALHPDLSSRVVRNYEGLCLSTCYFVESPDSDMTSGHGTHVAGIVAGDGTNSGGRFSGVAPGASLFGFGSGEGLHVIGPAGALDYIITNYKSFVPRIRIVTNSYGSTGEYNSEGSIPLLTNKLVSMGVTVVWAAGNSGGNGTEDMTTAYSKNPTPGVLSVANYDDHDLGARDNKLSASSSRGRSESPTTYPDLAAPGSNITSPCVQAIQPVCNLGRISAANQPWYATISGTSMAAPHVAGIAALLYQARPELTPAQVEDLLLDSAYKFPGGGEYETDPQNLDGTTSYDKGAGLVDAFGALKLLFAR